MKTLLAVSKLLRTFTEGVLLTVSFIIGIGFTSLVVKMIGGSPMNTNKQDSTWENPTGSTTETTMF